MPLWVRVRRAPQKGQLVLDVAKLKHVWQYEYQVGTMADGSEVIVWNETIHTTSKSRSNIIAGLESVKTYWVRVRGMNGLSVGG